MGAPEITSFLVQALYLTLLLSLPTILVAAIVGTLFSLLQALTQIQDQGLPTAVKFFAVMFALMMTYISVSTSIAAFANLLFGMIETI